MNDRFTLTRKRKRGGRRSANTPPPTVPNFPTPNKRVWVGGRKSLGIGLGSSGQRSAAQNGPEIIEVNSEQVVQPA